MGVFYNSGITYNSGVLYANGPAQPTGKKIIVKVALNMAGLKPPEKLTRLQTAINQLTGHAVFTAPSPTLIVAQAAHDAVQTKLDEMDQMESDLDTLRLER